MTGAGIACQLKAGRPVVDVVIVSGSVAQPTAELVIRYVANAQDDFPQQLVSLDVQLETDWGDLGDVDAAVVRSLDYSRSSREDTKRKRYTTEGVLLARARRHVDKVESLNGLAIAKELGCSKENAVARGEDLLPESKEAAAAGLAALSIAEGL